MNTKSITRKNTFARKTVSILLAVLTVVSLMAVSVYAASYPKPTDNVADSAGILSEGTLRSIKNANEELAKEVGAVIAVCTVSTTGETTISDYARAVFHDWNLGESILLLIAVDDKNYYFLQSTAIDDVLSNDEIASIAEEYLEGDFTSGTPDTGVMKVVAKLSGVLASKLPKANDEESAKQNTGSSLGHAIVTFFKVILYIVLAAVIIFVILFVLAMFNDDVAAIMQKYIFKRNSSSRSQQQNYQYDERLYGRQDQRRSYQNQNSRPNAQRSPRQNGDYRGYNNQRNSQNPYYNSDGTRRN